MAGKKSLVKKKETVQGIELNTVLFKDMVLRARKGASGNEIASPLTSMMAIELKDNKLTLITTDSNNYFYVMQDKVEGDDFYAVVMVDKFAALVSKTTSEKIKLVLDGNALKVIGNGEYTLELPEEEGNFVKFPDPRNSVELEPLEDIKLSTIKAIADTAKSSLAVTLEEPCLVNYYCGENIIATDTLKMCGMDIKLFDIPVLITPEMFNLLTLITSEDISVAAADDLIMFSTSDCVVFGHIADGIEDYPVEGINRLLTAEFPSSCKVAKSDLLQLLDRLSLFVTKGDKNVINLTFTKEGLQVSSKTSSGVELIKYIDSTDFEDYTCAIDIEMFASEVKAISGDAVEIHYGVPEIEDYDEEVNAVEFVEGNTKLFMCLADEEA